MNLKPIILATCTTLITFTGTVSAQPAEPDRPILNAALKASPSQRLEAANFYRSAYPNLPKYVYSDLKSAYPNLEHNVVDALLKTWEQHPGEMIEVANAAREQFGPRMQSLRAQVKAELEASYPNFEERLEKVLAENGVRPRWKKFVEASYPGLIGENRAAVKESFPQAKGWYPGKFREMFKNRAPGTNPVLDKLTGIVRDNPQLGPSIARKVVDMTRLRAPNLGEEVAKHFVDNQGQLREALQAEFPGAREKVVAVIEQHDPSLPGEVWSFVREQTTPVRADLRANLDAEMPGFEEIVKTAVQSRYPDLKSQVLAILTR